MLQSEIPEYGRYPRDAPTSPAVAPHCTNPAHLLKKSFELQNVAVSRQIVVSRRSAAVRDRIHINSDRGCRRFARFDRSLELLRLHERDSPRFPRDAPRSRIDTTDIPHALNRYHSPA